MTGNSTDWAPASSSSDRNRDIWVRERVIRTRLPKRGRRSNQANSSRRFTTLPITATTGGASPAPLPRLITFVMSPVTVRCLAQVPHCTNAAGVDDGIPSRASVSRMLSRVAQPISTTRVPPFLARISQGMDDSDLERSSLPLTTVNVVARPRCVRGIPA